jgi:hypothetical protein
MGSLIDLIRLNSNIVHQYFKKSEAGVKILLQVNPIHLKGVELTIPDAGEPSARELEFDAGIFATLIAEGYTVASPLEFHLYDAGLVGPGEEEEK